MKKYNLNGEPFRVRMTLERPIVNGMRATSSDLKDIIGKSAKVGRPSLGHQEAWVTLTVTQKNLSMIGPVLNRAGWFVRQAKQMKK
mgnify:CR=1 FL=1